ncbi:hypothetical protein AB0L75_28410 [Streptomyces sp. NPDC052101]|uniref:hypothetical protein n=1 Tax=Streptomyces sp. NPDC052101 TaxID=3155763 RepID=UPI00342B7F55
MPSPTSPSATHRQRLEQLTVFIRVSEEIQHAWGVYADEHTDLDDWPLDEDAYGRRAAQRDADTWWAFNRVRSFAKDLLATAEVQLQLLNPAHVQARWPWQLATLDDALKQLNALQQQWLDARDSLPSSARPGTDAYDDALAERNAEAWSYLDDWASHSPAILEIHAAAQDLPPRSSALTTVKAQPLSSAPATAPVARR